LRFAFDTYDREIERYGGPDAALLAEEIFGIDSATVIECLALLQRYPAVDPHDLVVATIDNLLLGLMVREADLAHWLSARRGDKVSSGSEYRKRQAILRSYVAHSDTQPDPGLPSAIRGCLESARQKLCPLGVGLTELESRSRLLQPMENLLSSFVHMHFNRLIGPNAKLEQLTLSLLCRTRETIAHLGVHSISSGKEKPWTDLKASGSRF
jgi:thiopeptide-type bacteriocin biosynthesis protein